MVIPRLSMLSLRIADKSLGTLTIYGWLASLAEVAYILSQQSRPHSFLGESPGEEV